MQTDTFAPVGQRFRLVAAEAALHPSLQVAAVGALAGTTLGALDYGRMALSSLPSQLTWSEHLAHVSLLFLAGYLAGLLGWFVLSLCGELGRWAGARSRVSERLAIGLVLATACLVVIVPVAVTLFDGRAIRQTSIARWGPWAVSVIGWVLCGAAVWALQGLIELLKTSHGALRRTAATAIAAGALLVPLIYFDLYTFYGLYGYLHAVLMALSFLVVALGWYVVLGAFRARVASLAGALLVLCLPAFAYSSTRYDAGLADFATHFAYTSRVISVARHVTDWDRDGYSNILGHKDAAILDPSIRPLAAEVPDNGTDEDGVFGDLSRTELAAARLKSARGRAIGARVQYRALTGAAPPPNLLLITIDTLRADRVLPENEADPPSFAAFKQSSVRFERAFASSSYTEMSVRMMMTGRYDVESATKSLFDVLHQAGCTTLLAFAETPFKILAGSQPNVVASFDQQVVVPDREPGDMAMFHSYAATRPTSEKIVADALRLLEANRQHRTCTWVYLFDVHQWQQLHDPEVVGGENSMGPGRYDKAVGYTLKQVSHLLDGLERLGLADNTVVALSGDHGEGLGEKGVVGHTRWVHDPVLHVPLIVRAPNLAPRDVRETPVGLIDLAPTILDLLDSESSLPEMHGTSLLPLMLGQPLEHAVFAREENYQAIFDAGYKLVIDRPEGRYRLYDLGNDPAEEKSLFDDPRYEHVARDLYHAYQAGPIGPHATPNSPRETFTSLRGP